MASSSALQSDDASIPGIPDQRTLALVNTYVVHTTELLNSFAISCEERLQDVRLRSAVVIFPSDYYLLLPLASHNRPRTPLSDTSIRWMSINSARQRA